VLVSGVLIVRSSGYADGAAKGRRSRLTGAQVFTGAGAWSLLQQTEIGRLPLRTGEGADVFSVN
jgi:hypothetical protein